MSRVLVIGASGFIGRHLVRLLEDTPEMAVSGTYCDRLPPDSSQDVCYQADVTDPESLKEVFEDANPDVVVHLAALSDVAEAERRPLWAEEINVNGTRHVARLCSRYGAKLVFLSSDYVFSGDRGFYRENEAPAPVVQYGKTKREAELVIARQSSRWSVLRTSLVYGWPERCGKGNLATAVVSALEEGRVFNGYTDMYRSPIYVGDLAKGILRLVQGDFWGTYHLAGENWVNMYQFALTVADAFGLDIRLVNPATSEDSESQVGRPKLLGLDSKETVNRLGLERSNMASGLEQMKNNRREQPWQVKS